MISVLRPPSRAWPAGLALAALLAVGCIGTYRYLANYWIYRGFAPPSDAAFVKVHGTTARFYVASAALGGRRQPVDVYLPPGYARIPRRRYPVLYLLHGVAGPARRVPRDGPHGRRRGRARRPAPRAADDPRDAVRVDRGRSPTRNGRTASAAISAGRRSSRATSSAPVDARYRTIRARQRPGARGLSEGGYGALNIGTSPSRRVPGAGELVRLRASRRHRRRSSATSERCCAANSPLVRSRRAAHCAAAQHRVRLVLLRHGRPRCRRQNTAIRARARAARGSPTASSSSAAATTGRSGVATRRARYLRRLGGLRGCVGHSACPSLLAGRDRRDRLALPVAAPAARGRGSADALPLDELRGTRRRHPLVSSSSGARPARRSASVRAGRGSERLTGGAPARARRRRSGPTSKRGVSIARRAPDLAARRRSTTRRGCSRSISPRSPWRALLAGIGDRADRDARSPLVVATVGRCGRAARTSSTPVLPGEDAGLLQLADARRGRAARRARPASLPRLALLVVARGLARRRQRRAWQVATSPRDGLDVPAPAARLRPRRARYRPSARRPRRAPARLRPSRRRPRGPAACSHAASSSRGARSASTRSARSGSTAWRPTSRSRVAFAARETLDGLLGARPCAARRTSPARSGAGSRSRVLAARRRGASAGCSPAGSRRGATGCARRPRERALARALVARLGSRHARAVRAARATSRTSSRPTSARSSPTASSAASRSSRATRSARASALDDVSAGFVAYAHARDWRIAILGASGGCAAAVPAHGLHALYHGDEAVVDDGGVLARRPADPQGAPVRAPARATPATACEVLRPSEIDAALRDELEAVARDVARRLRPSVGS